MPRKFLKRYLPDHKSLREQWYLRPFQALLHDPLGMPDHLQILEFLPDHGELNFTISFGREVELAASHTVEGNPMRFTVGTRALTVDDAWRTAMPPRDRAALTALTLPGLVRYGYPLRTGERRGTP